MQRLPISPAWHWMLVTKLVLWIAVFVYKTQHYPGWQYEHLLVDYHFGFTKRALLGALASFVFPKVPLWAVFAIGGSVWLATLGLFVAVFRRRFGFDANHIPLFVFMVASPFFFANFMQTIGYTDIFGCAFALILLLVPARSFLYIVFATVGAMALILIHHIHTLMYVPTLGAIVVARYYLAERRSAALIAAGLSMALPIAALLLFAQFAGSPPVSAGDFAAHMRSRMAGPVFPVISTSMWYQGLGDELSGTMASLTKNLLRVPLYVLVLVAHLPLIVYFRRLVASRDAASHRRLAWLAVTLISLAYLVMFIVVFDYSRWVSNWVVCMMLLMFAVKGLPAAMAAEPIPDDRSNRRFGWIVTAIPRIGTTIPF